MSIQEWTKLNALPYNASYPAYFYIYNGQLNFFPVPSATGSVIDLYAQIQAVDLTYQDTTGTIASGGMIVGSNLVLGSGTTWTTQYPANTDLTFANIFITSPSPYGDGINYQVQYFTGATGATLLKPVVNAPNQTGAGTYTIGQYPLLSPDFQDAIVYGALRIYFMSIVKDSERYGLYNQLYNEKLQQMEFYLATKTVNVDLSANPTQKNANLYIYATN